MTHTQRRIEGSSLLKRAGGATLVWSALLAFGVVAGDRTTFEARSGLEAATTAARAWNQDAVLVYVENDELLDGAGHAERWGYLFHSPSAKRSRVYSVRDRKIVVAEHLDIKFDAPPVSQEWIDSSVALQVAENRAGSEFRREQGGTLRAMLLMRGAFDDKDPDRTTWTVVYTSPSSPSLFVVIDASSGKVRRTWRG